VPTRDPHPSQADGPTAPRIPSFGSLRDPGRTALDVLMPPARTASGAVRSAPAQPAPAPARPTAVPARRPPDYADLVKLGRHVVTSLAALPARVLRRTVCEPLGRALHLGR
jgi:hypothetical protein